MISGKFGEILGTFWGNVSVLLGKFYVCLKGYLHQNGEVWSSRCICGVIQQTGPPERNSDRKCHISICRSRISLSHGLDCIFGLSGNIAMELFF